MKAAKDRVAYNTDDGRVFLESKYCYDRFEAHLYDAMGDMPDEFDEDNSTMTLYLIKRIAKKCFGVTDENK